MKGSKMKAKSLTILLTLALIFTMCFGTTSAFAADSSKFVLSSEDTAMADDAEMFELTSPTGVSAKAKGQSSIRVSWNAVNGADGYKVYCYSASADEYKAIKTVSADTTSYTQKGLEPDTTKAYKVAAYVEDVDGNAIVGTKSDKAKATTEDSKGAEKVMDLAKSKLGCAYVSGAAGPNAFDCSGFVWYVYNKTGAGKMSFSRSSAQGEYNQIKKYSIGSNLSNAKPGDILFFSYGGGTNGICHTGIYAGNNTVIHAANPRKGVCRSDLSSYASCGQRVCAIVRLAK